MDFSVYLLIYNLIKIITMKQQLLNLSAMIMLTVMIGVSNASAQSCDTLRNYTPPSDGSYTVWEEGANGMLLGQCNVSAGSNSYDIDLWMEPYSTGGPAKQVRAIRFLPSFVENKSGSATVDFVIYNDNAGNPGTIVHTESIDYEDINYDPTNPNSLFWNTIELTTPVSVTGTFWVGYKLSYSTTPWDKFQLATTRPSVNYTKLHLNGTAGSPLNDTWESVNDVFTDMDDDPINSAFALDVLLSNATPPEIGRAHV